MGGAGGGEGVGGGGGVGGAGGEGTGEGMYLFGHIQLGSLTQGGVGMERRGGDGCGDGGGGVGAVGGGPGRARCGMKAWGPGPAPNAAHG